MKKKLLILLVLVLGMMCAPSIVHAVTTTLVDEWGRVEAGDYTGYEFEVPDDGELEIELVGFDDDGIGEELEDFYGSYGEYNISLSNMAKDETPDGYDTFWDVDGETGFDDKSYAVDVEAGDYIIWLEEISGYYDFDYIVKVKHTPNKTETVVKPTSITLNKTSISLKKGATYQLTAKKNPSNAEGKITWTTSNKNVATVSSTGKVTAKGVGTATITAKCGTVSKKCTVKVTAVKPTAITLNKTSLSLKKGGTYQLKAQKKPTNAEGKITWITSNKNVATVSSTGKVTAKGVGKATITAKCGTVSKKCTVKVTKIKPTSLSLSKTNVTLVKGGTVKLTAKKKPVNADEKIIWKSSNPAVATVTSSGKVTGKKLGKATITVKCGTLTKKCHVTVNSIMIESWTGKTKALSSYVSHISGYKAAKWSSNKSSVVSVNESGKITTKKHGFAKIYCKISGNTYVFNVYSYSPDELEARAIEELESMLRNPSSLIINEVGYGTEPFSMYIDYSAMNGYGGYNRADFWVKYYKGMFFYYDEYYNTYVTTEWD